MKKIIIALLSFALVMSLFFGCGDPESRGADKLHILASTFPQYDWIRQILGEKAEDFELTLLLDSGVDLHSFQPSVADIAEISSCDMFVYVGGDSDTWAESALENATNKNMLVVNMLEVLGDKVKEQEFIEGMEHDHDHSHEVDPDNIYDRPLSDWVGTWSSIEKSLDDGSLDEYIADNAEANEVSPEEQRAAYEERWRSDYSAFEITETGLDFGKGLTDYEYIGYKLVEGEHGGSVWYGFKAAGTSAGAPIYIAFYDHGTGGNHGDHDDHEEEHHHDEAPHFHLRYGNESFDALTEIEGWSPTFFHSDATGEEVAETMSGHGHSHYHSHDHEFDEHVWLSLKNAQIITGHLADMLSDLDEENAEIYKSNSDSYIEKLADLDAQYKAVVDSSSTNTLLFADRFPFRYLFDDYGLDYYAAFSGCSAEAEASMETIVLLSNKVDELGLEYVLTIDGSNQKIAETIINSTGDKNQKILVLDSMQSVTAADVSSGADYLSIMEDNLQVLKEALS